MLHLPGLQHFGACADNIVIMPDYYARKTLTFILGERDPLLQAFRKRKASDDQKDAPKAEQPCL